MRRSVSVASPGSEPVSRAEAKKHLEIASADTSHDDHVDRLIKAARQCWERDTQRLTVQRTVTEKLAQFPSADFRLYYPVESVSSIKYYDESNSQQTLSTSVYSVDAPNRQIYLAVDQEWPTIETRWDAVEIQYLSGPSTIEEITKHAILLKIDEMFELRGMTKEKDSVIRAYESLVQRYMRGSYP